jgi:hypothetical protein
MGKREPLLFYDPCGTQLFFDQGVKGGFIFPYPGRQLLFDDLPDAVFTLHSQNDPVTAVVTHIYREKSFLESVRLTEVEFSQSAVGLYQFGELDVPDELYLHKVPFEIYS